MAATVLAAAVLLALAVAAPASAGDATSAAGEQRGGAAGARVSIDRISPYRFVRVRGARFAYRTLGRGRPLVLITGYGATLAEWDPELLERLAARRRVIVFDNRGAGLSTNPGNRRITIAGMAADTAALIRALRLRRPDVLGWSMGGYIAQELAIRSPRSVRRLVLASTDPGGAHAIQPTERVVRRLTNPNATPDDLMRLLYPPPAWPQGRQWLIRIAQVPGLVLPQSFVLDADTQRQQTRATGPGWEAPGRGALDRLHQIRAPTLIGAGLRDIVVPPGNARLLFNRIPRARLVRYRGAGHAFLFQDAARFAPRMLAFLTGPAPREPSMTG